MVSRSHSFGGFSKVTESEYPVTPIMIFNEIALRTMTYAICDRSIRELEMIKPGANDRKYYLSLTEDEVRELVWNADELVECFGLDKRIANYKGKRPIGLYRWDIEALYEVYSLILKEDKYYNKDEYSDKESPEYQALLSLFSKIKVLYDEASRDS